MPIRFLVALSFLLLPAICQAQLPNPDYYTVFQLTGGAGESQIIDSAGTVLHTWPSNINAPSGASSYLREDGLLLRAGQIGALPAGFLPGSWSTVQLLESDGTVAWEYTLQVPGQITLHHDLKPVGNGNILVTVWEFLPVAEMVALGWQPVGGVNGVWMERIQELEPNLVDGSTTVVWEWALENHLVQNANASAANFANVGAERGRVDINFNAGIASGDYFHISGIDYNAERDEIVLCPNNIDELWVIDHSTTTAEAATSKGGTRGQGGELIYRWGNPQVYDFNNGSTQPGFLRRAHDPRWSVDPVSGETQLTVHNNDQVDNTPGTADSQALLLDLPLNASGDYVIDDAETFLPAAPVVLYERDPANPFFSTPFMGGAQRLGNGNILITLALSRTMVEVDQAGQIVWQESIANGGTFIFKAQNYSVSYSGFQDLPFAKPDQTTAETVSVIRGIAISGIDADLDVSDDSDFVFQPGFTLASTEPPVWLLVNTVIPANASQATLQIEASANTPNINQVVDAFNFTTGQFEQVGEEAVSFNFDSVIDIDLDVSTHMQAGSGDVLNRVGYRTGGFTLVFPWSIAIDQVQWVSQ